MRCDYCPSAEILTANMSKMWVANFDPSSASSPFSNLFAAYRLWQSCPVKLSDGISRNSRERTNCILFGDYSWGFCLNLCKYWVFSSLSWKWGFVGICTKTVHIQLWVEKWGFCLYLCKNCVYLCVSFFGLKVRSLFGCVQQLRAFLLWVWTLQFVQKLWMEGKIVHILLWVES